MKPSQARLLTALILPLSAIAASRHDLVGTRHGVIELDETTTVDREAEEIIIEEDGLEQLFRCPSRSDKVLSFTKDEKYAGCCEDDEHLSGAPGNFECCGEDHDVTGSKKTGYTCCPTGQLFDGEECAEPKRCDNGKVKVDGKCVCPPETKEAADGTCKKTNKDDGNKDKCESGIQEGKCYTLRMDDGNLLGYNRVAGWYTSGKDSRHRMPGKFRFCKTEECDGTSPIDPNDGFRIQDLHGDANTGNNKNQWLDDKKNGGHIGKTSDYDKAGAFSVTKWSCGKYCLTGFDQGLSPTCPSADPAITFLTKDKQACRPVEIEEVPCDVRDKSNNCLWEGGAGTC